jgi:hypothetical protein
MKFNRLSPKTVPPAIAQVWQTASDLEIDWPKQKRSLYLFLALCFNLLVAPAVQAATGNEASRIQAYAIGLLILTTIAISIYLFFVMFVPEKF